MSGGNLLTRLLHTEKRFQSRAGEMKADSFCGLQQVCRASDDGTGARTIDVSSTGDNLYKTNQSHLLTGSACDCVDHEHEIHHLAETHTHAHLVQSSALFRSRILLT